MIINNGIKAIIDAMAKGESIEFAQHLRPVIGAYVSYRWGWEVWGSPKTKMFTVRRFV